MCDIINTFYPNQSLKKEDDNTLVMSLEDCSCTGFGDLMLCKPK